MPFWSQNSEINKQQIEAQAESRRMLTMGQLPLEAQRRIQLQNDKSNNFFSSALTNNEHLLMREAGYEPIGLVTGTSFFKVNYQDYYRKFLGGSKLLRSDVLENILQNRQESEFKGFLEKYWGIMGEIPLLTQTQMEAWKLAISRLQQEAALLGAHGVIGVHLKFKEHDWSSGSVEFTAIGTAIRLPNWTREQQPFTSNLSGQEFWKLHQAGYYPQGLVIGFSSYYIRPSWCTTRFASDLNGLGNQLHKSWQPYLDLVAESFRQELDEYTKAVQSSYYLARSRLSENIRKCEAEGAVGVDVITNIKDIEYERDERKVWDLIINCLAVGTAIVRNEQKTQPSVRSPLLFYNLAAGKFERWNYSKLI